MPADPDPNLWNLLRDDAKTLITLGTAVLGVSATFGKDLLAPNGSTSLLLLFAWILIALSIAAAVYASAEAFSRLKRSETPGGTVSTLLTISFGFLTIGLFLLAVVAYQNWGTSPNNPESQTITTAERAVADAQRAKITDLRADSYAALENHVAIVVVDGPTHRRYQVLVDSHTNEVIRLAPIERDDSSDHTTTTTTTTTTTPSTPGNA